MEQQRPMKPPIIVSVDNVLADDRSGNPITRTALAAMLGISTRTLRRHENDLPLKRIAGSRQQEASYVMPSNLELKQIIETFSGDFHRPQMPTLCWVPNQDRLKHALASHLRQNPNISFNSILLTMAWALRRQVLHAETDDSFQISARVHDRLVGSRKGKRIREILTAGGIWEKTRTYYAGSHCNGFKLADWCSEETEKVTLSWPRYPKTRKSQTLAQSHAAAGVSYPIESLQYIETSLGSLCLPLDFDIEDVIKQKGVTGARALKWRLAIDCFSVGRVGCKVGEHSGRLFHKASHLPKDVRKILEFDGQPTAEVDISNCQPLLLAVYFRDHASEMNISKSDVNKLLDMTCGGKFYQFLKISKELAEIEDAEFKRLVCQNLLFGWRHFMHTKIFDAFRCLVPTAANALFSLHHSDMRLAKRLQRMETELMFGSIVPQVTFGLGEIPIVTIHDSLIVPAHAGSAVAEHLVKSAHEALGVCPKVKLDTPKREKEANKKE
jgi:hypothetical protein